MFSGSVVFYYCMYLVGFAIMMIIYLKTHKRYGLSKRNAILATLYTYISGVLGAMLMGKIYSLVAERLGADDSSLVAIFGAVIFTPVLLMIFPVAKKERLGTLDMLAPGILVILACAKFGCFINGCCRGVVSDFGVHYLEHEETFFPVQLFETITMLVVLLATQLFFYKSKKFVKGTAYPITFAIYCVTRFLWENMRLYDSAMGNVLWGLTFWQIVCAAVFVVCTVITIIMYARHSKKVNEKAAE